MGVTIAPKARAAKPKNKGKKARAESVPEEEPTEKPKPGRGAKSKARKAEVVSEEEEPAEAEEPKARCSAKSKARKAKVVPEEEPEAEEPELRSAKSKARKAKAVPEEEPEDEEPQPRSAKSKARKAEAVPEEEPAEDEEPKSRCSAKSKARKAKVVPEEEPAEEPEPRSAKSKARKAKAVPEEEPEDEEPESGRAKPKKARKTEVVREEPAQPKSGSAKSKARKARAVPEEEPAEDEEPQPRSAKSKARKAKAVPEEEPAEDEEPQPRSAKSKARKAEVLEEPQEEHVKPSARKSKQSKAKPSPKSVYTPPKVRLNSKSKPNKRPKLAEDEEDVAVDSEAERLADVEAMLEEIDRVSEARSASKAGGKAEADEEQFPETLVDPAPTEAEGDEEQEEDEGNEEQGDDDEGNQEQGDDEGNEEGDDEPHEDDGEGDDDDDEGLVAPPDDLELPGLIQDIMADPSVKLESCATFKAGQDGLQERLRKAGHNQLSREDTLTDLSEMLKTLGPSASQLGYEHELSSMLQRVDLLLKEKARAHQTGKFASCPNLSQLMDGSLDRNRALREWVSKNGDIGAMEAKEWPATHSVETFFVPSSPVIGRWQSPSGAVYKGAGKKRGQFRCAAVKKEIGQLSNLIIDMSQADSPDLLKDLEAHDAKVKAFSLKLGMTKSGDKFDALCEQVHEEASLPPARDPEPQLIAWSLVEDGFVDSMYPSSADLEAYWAQLLPDFPDHWLKETYYFVPVAFRGDLKYLTQCFNFVRNASSAKVCFKCLASRSDPDMLYTDCSADAPWTATEYSEQEPWVDRPAFASIDGFDLQMVQVDWMHTWSLGVARDVLGSAIKLMCKDKSIYGGPTIAKRLNQLFKDLKIYAKVHGQTVAMKRLRKNTLRWSGGCPELHCKAADASTFMSFVRMKLQETPLEGAYRGLLGMVWAADELGRSALSSGVFLTMEQQRHIRVVGDVFLSSYCALATIACDRGEYYFKLRPKFHHLVHMVRDKRPSRRSPGWDNCYMDEDHVKHCLRILRKVSHRTAEKSLLQRNAVQVKQTMLDFLLPK
ncbi:unnamed protein product [Symbiodinium microadriaticum]|nr:unnamed protein product [Symbiodinium microadriaticum]